jgi:SAM-dependent methyltransferase
MPFSSIAFDQVLVDHVHRLAPGRVLDVGVGSGKHSQLIRDSGYQCVLDGIEPTESYLTEFDLLNKYNTIFPVSLQEFIRTQPRFQYDVVIFGDVLEHLFRSEALDYIDYFLYKCNWIIIAWPNNMAQDDYGGNAYEIHKSNFTINDLTQRFDVQYYIKQFAYYNDNNPHLSDAFLNYTVIKGYLTARHASVYNFPMWKQD